jgi:hypothetical protein
MPMACRRHYSCFHAAAAAAFADCLSSMPAVSCCAAIDLSRFLSAPWLFDDVLSFRRHASFAASRHDFHCHFAFIFFDAAIPDFHFRRLLRLFSLLFMPIISATFRFISRCFHIFDFSPPFHAT